MTIGYLDGGFAGLETFLNKINYLLSFALTFYFFYLNFSLPEVSRTSFPPKDSDAFCRSF